MNIIELIEVICNKELTHSLSVLSAIQFESKKKNKKTNSAKTEESQKDFFNDVSNCVEKLFCLVAISLQTDEKEEIKRENLLKIVKRISIVITKFFDLSSSQYIKIYPVPFFNLFMLFEGNGISITEAINKFGELPPEGKENFKMCFKQIMDLHLGESERIKHEEYGVIISKSFSLNIDKSLLSQYIKNILSKNNTKLIDLFKSCLDYDFFMKEKLFELFVENGLKSKEKFSIKLKEQSGVFVTMYLNVICYAAKFGFISSVQKFLNNHKIDFNEKIYAVEKENGEIKYFKFLEFVVMECQFKVSYEIAKFLLNSTLKIEISVEIFIVKFLVNIINKNDVSEFRQIIDLLKEEKNKILNKSSGTEQSIMIDGKSYKSARSVADLAIFKGKYEFLEILKENKIPLSPIGFLIALNVFDQKSLKKFLNNLEENPFQLLSLSLDRKEKIENKNDCEFAHEMMFFSWLQRNSHLFMECKNFKKWIINGEGFILAHELRKRGENIDDILKLLKAQLRNFEEEKISFEIQKDIAKKIDQEERKYLYSTSIQEVEGINIFKWLYQLFGEIDLNDLIQLGCFPLPIMDVSLLKIDFKKLTPIRISLTAMAIIFNNLKVFKLCIAEKDIEKEEIEFDFPLFTWAILNYVCVADQKRKKIASEILGILFDKNVPLNTPEKFYQLTSFEYGIMLLEKETLYLNRLLEIGISQLKSLKSVTVELFNRYINLALKHKADPKIINKLIDSTLPIDFQKNEENFVDFINYFSILEEDKLVVIRRMLELFLIDYNKFLKKSHDLKSNLNEDVEEKLKSYAAKLARILHVFFQLMIFNFTRYVPAKGQSVSLTQEMDNENLTKIFQKIDVLLKKRYLTVTSKNRDFPIQGINTCLVSNSKALLRCQPQIHDIFSEILEFFYDPYDEIMIAKSDQSGAIVWTILESICYLGFDSVLKILLDNFQNNQEKFAVSIQEDVRTAIHTRALALAIEGSHLGCVNLLFEYGLLPQLNRTDICSPFVAAIEKGNVSIMILLLDKLKDIILLTDIYQKKDSFLNLAFKHNQEAIFKLLINFLAEKLENEALSKVLGEVAKYITQYKNGKCHKFMAMIEASTTKGSFAKEAKQVYTQLHPETDSRLGKTETKEGNVLIKAKFSKQDQEKIIFIKKSVWKSLNEQERRIIEKTFHDTRVDFPTSKIKFIGNNAEKYGKAAEYKLKGFSPGSGAGNDRLILFKKSQLPKIDSLEDKDEKGQADYIAQITKHKK